MCGKGKYERCTSEELNLRLFNESTYGINAVSGLWHKTAPFGSPVVPDV